MGNNEKMICECCENEIDGENYIDVMGKIYCNDDCAFDDGWTKCENCGEWIRQEDTYASPDGYDYCYECFDDNFRVCECCGETVSIEDAIETQDGKWFCGSECAERKGYYMCVDCEEWSNETTYVENHGDVCETCMGDCEYNYCDRCANYYCNDEFYGEYADENGYDEYICERCYSELAQENAGNFIKHYHYYTEWQKMITEKEAEHFRRENILPLLFGFELEVENKKYKTSNNGMAGNIHNYLENKGLKNLLVFENDSSINDGFEIISQSMSYDFIKENALVLKSILEELNENGFASHDTTTCGLHIHVSRNKFDKDAISRLLYLFEKCKNELIIFSRRKYDQLTRWASFMNIETKDLSLDYIKSVGEDSSRYRAVNLTNSKTIEFRIFRGTLSHASLMSAIELINNIANISINCTDSQVINMNFKDVVNYYDTLFLKQYCVDRRIIDVEGVRR